MDAGQMLIERLEGLGGRFTVQTVASSDHVVSLDCEGGKFSIVRSPFPVGEVEPKTLAENLTPKAVADSVRKFVADGVPVVESLLVGEAVPKDRWPMTVLASARIKGRRPAVAVLVASGFKDFEDCECDPGQFFLAIQSGQRWKLCPLPTDPLLDAMEAGSSIFEAAFASERKAGLLLRSFDPEAFATEEARGIEQEIGSCSGSKPTGPLRT